MQLNVLSARGECPIQVTDDQQRRGQQRRATYIETAQANRPDNESCTPNMLTLERTRSGQDRMKNRSISLVASYNCTAAEPARARLRGGASSNAENFVRFFRFHFAYLLVGISERQ
jgi:hypothetical protein